MIPCFKYLNITLNYKKDGDIMKNSICGIYEITNTLNGKRFIGQTTDFKRRSYEYKYRKASNMKSHNYKIMIVIETYGFENFNMRLIHECPKHELDEMEMYYISKYKSYEPDRGYNRVYMGDDGKLKHSPESRRKMSISKTGSVQSSATKRNRSNKIIAIDTSFNIVYICDSGKLFGDVIGVGKDLIKNGLRNPSRVKGYRLYYYDKSKRDEIVNKLYKKSYIRDTDYITYYKYLDMTSVETIEKDFYVVYIRYEDFE